MDNPEQRKSGNADTSDDGTPAPPAGDGTPSRRKPGRRLAKLTVRSLLVLASIAALVVTAAGWTALDRLQREFSTSDVLAGGPGSSSADRATDILLVGSDSRTDAQGDPLPPEVLELLRTESIGGLNTDTLILVRVPDNGNAPTAVSIPRDTFVTVPRGGQQKINAVYGLTRSATADRLASNGATGSDRIRRESNLAGRRALVRTVESLTGVHVDHYAEVNLLGFYEVTEAVGGVEVCLRQATSDGNSGADFPAGHQTISGGDALAFVRQRHGLPRGDLDRIVRQQVFMAAVARKVLSTGTLTDTNKLDELITVARRSVVLDKDWKVLEFARRMQRLASGGVRFVTLPIIDAAASNDRGQSIVTVDPAEVRAFTGGLVHGPPSPDGRTRSSSPATAPETAPTHRLGPPPPVRLDGDVDRRAENRPPEPITSGEIACVN